jgi:hypothetical protein
VSGENGPSRAQASAALVARERLYGVPDAESLYDDLGSAYERQIEDYVDDHDRRPRVLVEWTVHPPKHHLPHASTIVEWLAERAAEDGGIDEGYSDHIDAIMRAPEVLVAADALLDAIAARITYRMAHEKVAEHVITWDAEGEPLVDGTPMYARSLAVPNGAS